MFGYFRYTVKIWIDGREHTEVGITYAENFEKAVGYIEDYYGEDLGELTIKALEPYSVYILSGPTCYDDDE